MSRASEALLAELHDAAAKLLLSRIASGEATASDVANALKMLKDNDITCIPAGDNALGKLADQLNGKSVGDATQTDLESALESMQWNEARQ